ncbi:uncharacterized protein LOC128228144 isoform X2 [Mya arenaria]|uniref:uncharacterized protein LOC128228144 isoform X2 n=1 Tax=Mya arenaria TaxID=6604 RepID=UPI0022E65907|nr:uncharacterized protein LOC128228144 isoform X2 [Mya arenaria]
MFSRCPFCVQKCQKDLGQGTASVCKRYAKSNKPSIKSESGLTNFEIVSMQVQLDQKDNEIHDLKENVRKLAQDKRQAEMEKQDALTSKRYAKSNKPSIKSESGLTNFEIVSMQVQLDQKDNEIHDLKENVRKLAQDKRQAEMEKQDALTRLSEVISVKLRDNNPNIADLNDPFRPTKLAEMFSELYEDEWTALYTVLEAYKVKDEQMIDFLLDVFMESFTFCKTKLDTNWQLVTGWYFDENLPNSKSLKKAFKDGRKSMVPRLLTEIEKKFNTYLCGFCKNASLQPVLTSGKMKEYVSSCAKLSLLMNASDLPVIVDCPGWVPCTPDYQSEQDEHSGVFEQATVNAEGDESNKNSTSDLKERRDFNKELFKEYTVRGKYVEFFVWPVMYLHENGPVLTKGIAQGTENKMVSDDDHRWMWWKTTNIV